MKKSTIISTVVGSLLIAVQALAIGDSQVADRVYTVKEFTDNIGFAKVVDEKCENNPGELRDDPNCVNAREAVAKDRLIGSGGEDSFKAPRID